MYKRESFFCFYSIVVPSWSLARGGGLHVSARSFTLCVSPYAFPFLPCIWAGAPAWALIQRHSCGHSDTRRQGTHTDTQGCGCGHYDGRQPSYGAGASFHAGVAGDLQGGAAFPSPHPSFQKRQGKTSWLAAEWPSGCGSFLGPRARDGTPAPRVRGFCGFCFLGIRDRSGATKVKQRAALRIPEVPVPLEVRHG